MKKIKVELHMYNALNMEHVFYPVDVYQTPVPGLCVHHVFKYRKDTFEIVQSHYWTVTHAQSGTAVNAGIKFPRRSEALKFAEWLGTVLDWTLDEKRIRKLLESVDIGEAAKAKAQEIVSEGAK